MKIFLILLLSTFVLACGDDASDVEIVDQVLQGTINGEAWTFVDGFATLRESDGTVSITMLPTKLDEASPCRDPLDFDGARILMIRKPEVAESEMSLANNITFTFDGPDHIENHVATEGSWRFDFVDDNVIRGGMYATTEGHEVNGTFELTRCPDPFADF